MHLLFVFSVLSRPCSRTRIYNVVQVKWIGDRFWCQNTRYQKNNTNSELNSKFVLFTLWRRRRDLNSCHHYWCYSLSRGAPWASWVLLQRFKREVFYLLFQRYITIPYFNRKVKAFYAPEPKIPCEKSKKWKIFLSVCCQPWFFNKNVIQYWYWKRAGARKSDNDRKTGRLTITR